MLLSEGLAALLVLPALCQSPSGGGHGRAAAEAHSLPVTAGPEYHDLRRQIAARNGQVYVPVESEALIGRLRATEDSGWVREVRSVIPRASPEDAPFGVAIVAKAADKPALLRFLRRNPQGAAFPADQAARKVFTVDGHLEAVRKNLAFVDAHAGKKGYWILDLAALRSRILDRFADRERKVDAVLFTYHPEGQKADSASHRAPVPKLSAGDQGDARRELLSEMWQRRILAADMSQPSPDDLRTLERMRTAEAGGAVEDLRLKAVPLAGLVAEIALSGQAYKRSVLTKEGYERWLFLRSQDAIAFFEKKGVDAKWVFKLRDMDGRPLFRSGGRLTEAGDKVYTRASLGMKMFWLLPSGEAMGTRPPPKRQAPAPAVLPPAPPPQPAVAPPAQPQAQPPAPPAPAPAAPPEGGAP
ncbi:MAG: hypothetical protein HY924_12410 [Elusimicrobia bacterium]|nr:hypothetical protein [Elusimicrobiota bacterium]